MNGIAGFEEYEHDFRLVALPEYRWMAEQLLQEALEGCTPLENLDVYMPDCLCNDSSGYTFMFQARTESGENGYPLLYTGFY